MSGPIPLCECGREPNAWRFCVCNDAAPMTRLSDDEAVTAAAERAIRVVFPGAVDHVRRQTADLVLSAVRPLIEADARTRAIEEAIAAVREAQNTREQWSDTGHADPVAALRALLSGDAPTPDTDGGTAFDRAMADPAYVAELKRRAAERLAPDTDKETGQ